MRNLIELSEWVNDNSTKIIKLIPQKGVNNYLTIGEHFLKGNVSNNKEFQNIFKSFYGLNIAHLTKQFDNSYFMKFDNYREQIITEETINLFLEEWYSIPNSRECNTVQFSFLSKLLHTIDNDKIIYDKWVRILFELKGVSSIKGLCFQEKVDIYYDQYKQLQNAYRMLIDSGDLDNVIIKFEKHFPQAIEISKVKKIDFIFWKAGKLWEATKNK
jgi:hypothetical protein